MLFGWLRQDVYNAKDSPHNKKIVPSPTQTSPVIYVREQTMYNYLSLNYSILYMNSKLLFFFILMYIEMLKDAITIEPKAVFCFLRNSSPGVIQKITFGIESSTYYTSIILCLLPSQWFSNIGTQPLPTMGFKKQSIQSPPGISNVYPGYKPLFHIDV